MYNTQNEIYSDIHHSNPSNRLLYFVPTYILLKPSMKLTMNNLKFIGMHYFIRYPDIMLYEGLSKVTGRATSAA